MGSAIFFFSSEISARWGLQIKLKAFVYGLFKWNCFQKDDLLFAPDCYKHSDLCSKKSNAMQLVVKIIKAN